MRVAGEPAARIASIAIFHPAGPGMCRTAAKGSPDCAMRESF
ncbi:MAG: hypothetical protein ACKO3W_09040 [bacterium]